MLVCDHYHFQHRQLESLLKEQGPQANIQYLKAIKQADESVHETLVFIT